MQHLDEGTIHTWLDGQLPRDEAQSVEAHVAECRECADAVAEARGLIAASSRILTALDSVPREVVPKTTPARGEAQTTSSAVAGNAPGTMSRAEQRAHRRWFTGGSLTAAAAIVVAIGTVTLMRAARRQHTFTESVVAASPRSGPSPDSTFAVAAPSAAIGARSSAAPAPVPAAPAPVSTLGNARDAERRLAAVPSEQPASRDKAGVGGRAVDGDRVRERSEEPKRVGAFRAAEPASNAAPDVAPAKVRQQVAASEIAKPVDELTKDSKKELDQRAPGVAVTTRGASGGQTAARAQAETAPAPRALADSVRLDRAQPAADVAVAKQATTGTVRGRVTDANNTGLADVRVMVAGTNTGVVTNQAGEFTLGGVSAGSHRLSAMRIGYAAGVRDVIVTAGQTLTADIVLTPSSVALTEGVVTGAAVSRRVPQGAQKAAAPAAAADIPPGAPITAAQSNAVGCYELGITPGQAQSRTGFRQVPRRIALDSEIMPANAEGVWYRARDLARTGTVPNGLWRPTGPDAIELEWTYGSRTARVRVAGPAGSMMRGTVEEIDRATATGEAGTVVAIRRPCEG